RPRPGARRSPARCPSSHRSPGRRGPPTRGCPWPGEPTATGGSATGGAITRRRRRGGGRRRRVRRSTLREVGFEGVEDHGGGPMPPGPGQGVAVLGGRGGQVG